MRPAISMRPVLFIASIAALTLLTFALIAPEPAAAQTLPYKVWGGDRIPGEAIQALKNTTVLGETTVAANGGWAINIHLGGTANVASGDTIKLTVNGNAVHETFVYQSGQFSPAPGMILTVAVAVPVPTPAPVVQQGGFASAPIFDGTGRSLVVFTGGSVDDLGTAAGKTAATGAWVQDGDGVFHLYIVGGPAFVAAGFASKFPNGFTGFTSVLLVK